MKKEIKKGILILGGVFLGFVFFAYPANSIADETFGEFNLSITDISIEVPRVPPPSMAARESAAKFDDPDARNLDAELFRLEGLIRITTGAEQQKYRRERAALWNKRKQHTKIASQYPPLPEVSRLAAIDAEISCQAKEWDRSEEQKKKDTLQYRIIPLAAERKTLIDRIQNERGHKYSFAFPSPDVTRAIETMYGYFPARLKQAEGELKELLASPVLNDPARGKTFYNDEIVSRAGRRRSLIEFLRAAHLPCDADPALTEQIQNLENRFGRYRKFLAYLENVFCGSNEMNIPFVRSRCLGMVTRLLERQSYYTGPGFNELMTASCNQAIRNLRRAGLLKEGLTKEQIERYAMKGPLVALIAGTSATQHVGIIALHNGEVKFFSNSVGRKRIEPLANRMGKITGVLILK